MLLQEHAADGDVKVHKVPSETNPADLLTKDLAQELHKRRNKDGSVGVKRFTACDATAEDRARVTAEIRAERAAVEARGEQAGRRLHQLHRGKMWVPPGDWVNGAWQDDANGYSCLVCRRGVKFNVTRNRARLEQDECAGQPETDRGSCKNCRQTRKSIACLASHDVAFPKRRRAKTLYVPIPNRYPLGQFPCPESSKGV